MNKLLLFIIAALTFGSGCASEHAQANNEQAKVKSEDVIHVFEEHKEEFIKLRQYCQDDSNQYRSVRLSFDYGELQIYILEKNEADLSDLDHGTEIADLMKAIPVEALEFGTENIGFGAVVAYNTCDMDDDTTGGSEEHWIKYYDGEPSDLDSRNGKRIDLGDSWYYCTVNYN